VHLKYVIVPKECKESLKKYLENLGLSEASLFNDIPGLAEINKSNKPLQPTMSQPTPDQLMKRGNLAYQRGDYENALSLYKSYAEKRPNVAQPYCLIGDTLTKLERFKDADFAYTTAIHNLDMPIYPDENKFQNQELFSKIMRSWLYYNRGNARAATGDHIEAVEDFDLALQYGCISKQNALKNRGNSKFAMQKFKEAYQDFKAANSEQAGSGVALAMGNCKVRAGEFEHAEQHYLTGATAEPEGSAKHCQKNAEQVRQIVERLDGNDFQIRNEEKLLIIEIAHIQELPLFYPFAGNQGNTGNQASGMTLAQGGDGYEGMDGFVVVIQPATS